MFNPPPPLFCQGTVARSQSQGSGQHLHITRACPLLHHSNHSLTIVLEFNNFCSCFKGGLDERSVACLAYVDHQLFL